jgi:hypothetical protein
MNIAGFPVKNAGFDRHMTEAKQRKTKHEMNEGVRDKGLASDGVVFQVSQEGYRERVLQTVVFQTLTMRRDERLEDSRHEIHQGRSGWACPVGHRGSSVVNVGGFHISYS